jgi:DNA-binding NarL/FixJ family response regulator
VAAIVDEWPLVGREAELAQIAAALSDRGCPAAVIDAPAGTGKSRLAREACAAARADGAQAVWVQATASSATIPLGALAAVIPDEVRSDDTLELVRRSAAALRSLADGRTVLLAVDDAQLLDPASAALVLALTASPDVFVLATIRTGEATPDAVDALWKDAGGRRIELTRISDEAIAMLVETGLDGPVAQAAMRRILDACVGNPLYARELVIGALEEQRLVCRHGLWQIDGSPTLPPSLTALVSRRTRTLGGELRRPLELLALGQPLRLDELAGLTSFEALENCEERGLISVGGPSDDAAVGLTHPLYGEVIRAEMPVLRARGLRLSLAEAIQRRHPMTPDDALRAARWLMDAGAEIPHALLLDAAEAANLAGDPALAETLSSRAVDGGAGIPAVLLLGRALVLRNCFADAEAVLSAGEAAAADSAQALEYFGQRMHVLYWGLRRPEEARALLSRAEGWSGDPEWAATLEPWRMTIPGFGEGFAQQLEPIREMMKRPDLDAHTRRSLEQAEGMALFNAGRVREASSVVRRLRPRPPLRDEIDTYTLGLVYLIGQASGDDWPDLSRYMRETLRAAIRAVDHQAAGLAAAMLGELAMHAGRYRDAARWLADAETHLEHHDTFDSISCIRGLQAGIACHTGEPAAAQAAVESMRRRTSRRTPNPTQLVYLLCAEGWAARARSAADGAEVFRERAQSTTDQVVRARLFYEALLAGARPDGIASELTRLAADGDCGLTETHAAHAVALAHRDAGALLAAGEQLAAIGCAAAAVQAIVAAAREFLAQGRRDSARRAAVRARELYPSGQGWEMPVIDGLDGVAVELTRRESQLAALASRGLSNQEIADQLMLSVRTVETYIYRAMQKRGVDNRRDL